MIVTGTLEDFISKFKPLDLQGSNQELPVIEIDLEGMELVNKHLEASPFNVWTMTAEGSEEPVIVNGAQLVNRIGFLITEKPFSKGCNYCFQDPEEENHLVFGRYKGFLQTEDTWAFDVDKAIKMKRTNAQEKAEQLNVDGYSYHAVFEDDVRKTSFDNLRVHIAKTMTMAAQPEVLGLVFSDFEYELYYAGDGQWGFKGHDDSFSSEELANKLCSLLDGCDPSALVNYANDYLGDSAYEYLSDGEFLVIDIL